MSEQKQQANENTLLDPRAIHTLLEAVDIATKRGAYDIKEVGNIASAYNHTITALTNLSKAHNEQVAQSVETSDKKNKQTSQKKGESK